MPLALHGPALIQRLKSQPESGIGYQLLTVVLKDGRRFERVTAVEGQLTDFAGAWEPPFGEGDIEDLVVTHDRSGSPIEVWIVGAEHKESIFERLGQTLRMLGYTPSEENFGIAGSQELRQWEIDGPDGAISIEAETYVGLSVTGPASIVERIRQTFEANRASPK